MIYVLIAATYTPVALLVLHGPWRVAMLAAVWAGAVLGIALKLARIDGFRVATAAL
jgi:hemolysin III